jgi:hypothetical protein
MPSAEKGVSLFVHWVLYGSPSDFPGKFVARKHIVYSDGRIVPQPDRHVFGTEKEAHAWGQRLANGHWIDRLVGDDPAIVGVWI